MAPSTSNGIEEHNNPRLLTKPKNALSCNTDQIAYVELYRPKTIVNNTSTSSSNDDNNGGGKKTKKKKKRRAPLKKYHLLFAILYLYQMYWIYSTIGLPYKEFLDKAEREGFEGKFFFCYVDIIYIVCRQFYTCCMSIQ